MSKHHQDEHRRERREVANALRSIRDPREEDSEEFSGTDPIPHHATDGMRPPKARKRDEAKRDDLRRTGFRERKEALKSAVTEC
jgi:hypothetical protein